MPSPHSAARQVENVIELVERRPNDLNGAHGLEPAPPDRQAIRTHLSETHDSFRELLLTSAGQQWTTHSKPWRLRALSPSTILADHGVTTVDHQVLEDLAAIGTQQLQNPDDLLLLPLYDVDFPIQVFGTFERLSRAEGLIQVEAGTIVDAANDKAQGLLEDVPSSARLSQEPSVWRHKMEQMASKIILTVCDTQHLPPICSLQPPILTLLPDIK
ncbi:hypothetical protein OC835_007988 [Tilletia horrida]|nr:hypothetical protein OC835_007988 [Tilletia horrida]